MTQAAAANLPLKAPVKAADFNPFWVEADGLGWSVKGDHLPALVTTSPAGTPQAQAGVLGLPTTTVLFGNSDVNDDWRAGGRITAGYWFDPSRSGKSRRGSSALATSRPALPPITAPRRSSRGRSSTRPATCRMRRSSRSRGSAEGSVRAITEKSRLLGAGALYRQDLGMWGSQRISALIGYRYLRSSDDLAIASQSILAGGGATLAVSDSFGATSQFHGLDLGLAGEWRGGPWSLEWRGKVALGGNINDSTINGATATTGFHGFAAVTAGGVLTQPGNIGNSSQTRFAAVPELSLEAGTRSRCAGSSSPAMTCCTGAACSARAG